MFATFTRMRKLESATDGRDEPAPIYLLDELASDAQSGMPEVGLMVEFCVKRLTARPPVVKQKTLRLIKHLCNKGAHEFRRAMARHSTSVRELTHYKGEPDPLKGDVPNQRVRDAAREALDALFGAENGYAPTSMPAQPQLTNRIQGFGSTNYSGSGGGSSFGGGGGGGGASSEGVGGMLGSGLALGQSALNKAAGAVSNASSAVSRGMQGFGNPKYESGLQAAPSYTPPRGGSSIGGGGGGGNVASPRWGASVAGAAGSALSGAGSAISGAGSAISGALSPRHCGHGSESMLGGQGAGGYDSDDEPSFSHQPLARALPRASAASTGAVADEAELVDHVCAPGGVRATPGAEELRTFVEALAPLDGLEVGRLLAAKMEGPSWQACLRALCALEAVVQRGSSAACGEAAVFFQSDPSALQAAAKSPQATVRARARAVLAAIGADTLPDASASSPAGQPASAAQPGQAEAEPDLMGDLLGGDNDPAQQPQQMHAAAAAPPALPAAAPGGDLMELLGGADAQPPQQQSAASAPTPAAPGGGMFDGLSLARAQSSGAGQPAAPAAQHQLSPQQGTDSLFGGLAMADGGSAAAQPLTQHVRPPADELADLFTSLSPVDAASSTAGVAGSASSMRSGGFGAPTPAAQQPTWPAQAQAQQQQQYQAGVAAPPAGLANGGSGSHMQAPTAGALNPGGSGHARTNSGSGAFEDLDLEFRKQRPMGGGSLHTRTTSGASAASFGTASPAPQINTMSGGIMPGVAPGARLQMQQEPWQQYSQAPPAPYAQQQQYAAYGQQMYAQPAVQQPQQWQQAAPPQLQPGMAQQPPLSPPAHGTATGLGGISGVVPGPSLSIGHARTSSTGLVGNSPTAAMARETLQQAGVPEGFAPRPEHQEAAFDFVGDHISQLKK